MNPEKRTSQSYLAVPLETEKIGKIVLGQNNEANHIEYILFGSGFPWPMFLPAINGGSAISVP